MKAHVCPDAATTPAYAHSDQQHGQEVQLIGTDSEEHLHPEEEERDGTDGRSLKHQPAEATESFIGFFFPPRFQKKTSKV